MRAFGFPAGRTIVRDNLTKRWTIRQMHTKKQIVRTQQSAQRMHGLAASALADEDRTAADQPDVARRHVAG
jgi:hypothetical protein